MKRNIIAFRRQIFDNLKTKALSYEGHRSVQLQEYQDNQTKLGQRNFYQSSIDQLLTSIEQSQVIYLGDFHTFDQNVRNVLRVIKHLLDEEHHCAIGLEMVHSIHQVYIDAFLNNHITELEFLESIEYHQSWRFPWSHYKLIFDLAKKNNLKVYGLNSTGSLSQRDEFACEHISDIISNTPKLLVLFGELHLCKNKIPELVQNKMKTSQTIIHQNLDEVYWKIMNDNKGFDLVQFSEDEFCINAAPPWIKYESMIYWYENLSDDPDFDIHEYIIENGGHKIFTNDTRENFLILIRQLTQTLDLKLSKNQVEDFNLYDHISLDFVENAIDQIEDKATRQLYDYLVLTGESFRLQKSQSYYCSSYSVNRLAYLSGLHIYHLFQKDLDSEYELKNSFAQQTGIIKYIYSYCAGYLFSKLINPHRKCSLYLDFAFNNEDIPMSKKIKSIIDDNQIASSIHSLEFKSKFLISKKVGHFLGEYLYREISKPDSNFNFTDDFLLQPINDFSFQIFKRKLLQNFQYKNHQKRYF